MIQHHNINDGEDHEPIPEHTPGPWMQNPGHPTVWHNGDFVCQTCHHGEHPSEQQILNARLIAAAPEMLDALETLLNLREWERLECVSLDCVRAHDCADDTVRKAKGWL